MPERRQLFSAADIPITDGSTPDKIARLLGLNIDFSGDEHFDVLIVGGGPAGVAAAVYAGAEGLRALVVEDIALGVKRDVEPNRELHGFPTGISAQTSCGAARCRR